MLADLAPVERRIIGAILDAAAARGWHVSVFDGEEWALRPTCDGAAIRDAIGATDETRLRFRDPARLAGEGVIGDVWLIHGNGCDVIHDYWDNPAMVALLYPALKLAEAEAV